LASTRRGLFSPHRGCLALDFRKKEIAAPIPDGSIALRNYFDPHNSRKLLVYPAAWPMPVGQDGILTWLLLSDGAGFRGGTAAIQVSGPEGLVFSTGIINGAKFHNGQIVGGYELPANAPAETARASSHLTRRWREVDSNPRSPVIKNKRG
jgi:hypothetical protein